MSANRALLDELMGVNRNALPHERKREREWPDDDVCKHYLCGLCPHDLFPNTKMDLGKCAKVHDDKLREAYQTSSRKGELGFELAHNNFLEETVRSVERVIRANTERMHVGPGSEAQRQQDRAQRIARVNEQIAELTSRAQDLGAQGQVDEASAIMRDIERLTNDKTKLERPDEDGRDNSLEVCQICGALLIVGDAQERVDAHIQGKVHVGYALIRDMLAKYKQEGFPTALRGPPRPFGRDDDRDRDRDRSDRGRDRDRYDDRDDRRRRSYHDLDRDDRR
ncbi:hypothetical protein, variant [Capsaspora owczarzaki ATCC 30864]|uniref:LUC7-domain-containing protein n=1 Tax=Capsaspora owczarzaki (strain ATCC 30864) TaxID=595528 RepID=A0A0D2X551_CAPO3|nr:hypothetical protein, variant [Capsaspora owczarzaki ATCC 30864]